MLATLKKYRRYAAPLLVLLTAAVFIYFFATHPRVRHTLTSISPLVIAEVVGLYALFIVCLTWVYDVTLRLCGVKLGFKEQLLLTCYSTIANFFGPLQSGPGVRAAYLKTKHNVKLRDYTLASLLYYALYAITSATFLLIGSGRYWPLMAAALVAVTIGSLGIVWLARRKFTAKYDADFRPRPRLVAELFVATVVQLSIWAAIFYVELLAIHSGAKPTQAIAYGGTANFAVFVSLTPGAIGFREAFLTFTQKLHGIDTANIFAANLVDRAIYVAFLGLLFLIVLGLHADRRFRSETPKSDLPAPQD